METLWLFRENTDFVQIMANLTVKIMQIFSNDNKKRGIHEN